MIVRRIAEGLKQQHWTSVGVELVILVLGVFIGIQVSNWNEQRAEAGLGKDYVQRLISDLEQDQSGVRAHAAYYAEVLKSVQFTDELLRSVDPDSFMLVVNAYRATEITYIPPERATWDQIVSSGHLGLLPAGVIESGLSTYYAFDNAQDSYRHALDSSYRTTVRRIIPLPIQLAIRTGCSDVYDKMGNAIGFIKECKLDVDAEALEEVASALRSDPEVAANLRYQYSIAATAVLNMNGANRAIAGALSALGAEPKAVEKVSQ